MGDVMRALGVKEFWDSGFPHSTKTYSDMLEEIKRRGIMFYTPKRGESRRFDQVLVEVVHPGPEPVDDNPNNDSLTVRVTFGGNRFLFTGDSEVEAWAQMMRATKDGLRADLLKAAHHGSSNGTTEQVLDAVRPSIVTISCRLGNDYHHPHPRVVDLLERHQGTVSLYRTDLQGTITATSDGATIDVTTEKQVDRSQLYLTGDEAAGNTASSRGGDAPKRRSAKGGR
jgi:beta-lactamase superfamily II metal-dependent hydrolase